jgi:hypothetical protein
VETDCPIVAYSRPVPFALRPTVKSQIDQMIKDDILEIGNSSFLNPLTIGQRDDKKPRISVNACKVNQSIISDNERTPPLQELLPNSDLKINSRVEADKAARDFTASVASACRMAASKITLSSMNNEFLVWIGY